MSEKEIKGKTVIVTGGASGLGSYITKYFVKEGAKKVIIFDINVTLGNRVVKEINAAHPNVSHFVKCDVSSGESVDSALKSARSIAGYIDVVVNNAGIMNDASYDKMININFKGTVDISRKLYGTMRADKDGKGGTILNISSVLGGIINPILPVYQATKAAIIMFSCSLGHSLNYDRTKIRVLNVAFGPTETNLLNDLEAKGFDEVHSVYLSSTKIYKQRPESAADAVVEAFKRGGSGSTWVCINDEPVMERTAEIQQGYSLFMPPKSMNALDDDGKEIDLPF